MDTNDQKLGHQLKLIFGIAPSNPNTEQLEFIKRDIKALVAKGITPNEKDWAEIVKRHCPDAGSYHYRGADTSDIITLLQLATNK